MWSGLVHLKDVLVLKVWPAIKGFFLRLKDKVQSLLTNEK